MKQYFSLIRIFYFAFIGLVKPIKAKALSFYN